MAKWSLSSDFSIIQNPSSVWSYGSKPAGFYVTGAFNLFTHLDPEPYNRSEIVAWFGSDTVWYTHWLGVYYNTKPTDVILNEPMLFTGNSVAMHPGDDGRFSVVRFTAPKDGNYTINATFTHITAVCAQHSGAYIVYNNLMTLWEVGLAGPGDSKSFKTTDSGITVRANEPIDFIVGVGLDNIFSCDMTSARVDIHLLDTLENQPGSSPTITRPIGFVLGIIISAILIYIFYRCRVDIILNRVLENILNRYRENRRNNNVDYQVIN